MNSCQPKKAEGTRIHKIEREARKIKSRSSHTGTKRIHSFVPVLACVHVTYSHRKTDKMSSKNSGTHSWGCRGLKWHM